MSDSVRRAKRALDRDAREAAWAKEQDIDGHAIDVDHSYGKFFRSRPGSADWKPSCSCGWVSSQWCYGEQDAWARAAWHLRKILREAREA